MGVDIAGVIVAVRVSDDQGLVPGEEVFRKLLGQRVRLVRREPMIRSVPGIEADDEGSITKANATYTE